MTASTRVVVAVPTYRRPHALHRLLPVLLRQCAHVPEPFEARVVVVDNDPEASAREAATTYDVAYVVEPGPGVSAARNRCLAEAADDNLLVFIDDDEVPVDGWLPALIDTWSRFRAPGVAGPVERIYPEPTVSPWQQLDDLRHCGYARTGAALRTAPTGNLLLDLGQVRAAGLTFDARFGLTGGEDSHFTRRLSSWAGPLRWCDEALVREHVERNRQNWQWTVKRSFGQGASESRIAADLASSRCHVALGSIAGGIGRLGLGPLRSLRGLVRQDRLAVAMGVRTTVKGLGMVVGTAGLDWQQYATGGRASGRRHGRWHGGPAQEGQPMTDVQQAASHAEISVEHPLRVLESVPAPEIALNPYLSLLGRGIEQVPGVEVSYFSWRNALRGTYDVVHFHWPEVLLTGGRPGWRNTARQVLAVGLLAKLAVSDTKVVRTVHNIELPRGLNRFQRAYLGAMDELVDTRVVLNAHTPTPGNRPVVLVPHGHYRDWIEQIPVPTRQPGRVAFIGMIRRYKNVGGLLHAFGQTRAAHPDYRLTVSGRPSGDELVSELRDIAGDDDRVAFTFGYLKDEDLVAAVGRAVLTVLPYPEMHNSGTVLMSLSVGRPVLVPDNEVNRELADEVGRQWVVTYAGELSDTHLVEAIAAAEQIRAGERPDLSAREWDRGAQGHVAAFRAACDQPTDRLRTLWRVSRAFAKAMATTGP